MTKDKENKSQKGGLGRGLDALWGENITIEEEKQNKVQMIGINQIDPNREQARKYFDAEKLEELAASIQSTGIIQPLILRQNGERYTIVAGERRWRAARLVGVTEVPAIVRDYDDKSLLEISLIENLQRADLNPIEEASGIKLLMQEHDLTQEEVSTRIGKSRSAVANSLRLLSLPDDVLIMLRDGTLTAGHGRCLAGLPTPELQSFAAKEIEKRSLSVRQAEMLCQNLKDEAQENKKEKSKKSLTPEMYDVQNRMQTLLGTKVNLHGTEKRGKIVIEYYSRVQLEQLYEYFGGKPE